MRLSALLLVLPIQTCFPALLFAQNTITSANWGSVTAPVYGMFQAGTYGGAELFPGPNRNGQYYSGVLPNGRIVTPASLATVQVGMNPIECAVTQDTRFLIVVNSSERQTGYTSFRNSNNTGGYSLSVVDNSSFTVVSTLSTAGSVFTGLLVAGSGPYTVYVSGGADNSVKIFTLSLTGTLAAAKPASIAIPPLLPNNAGYASHYSPAATAPAISALGYSQAGAQATYPAGMRLSPDGRFLYVACLADNSLAVIDVYQNAIINQLPAGYFPYGVAVSYDGQRIYTANWGVTSYGFANPTFDSNSGHLLSAAPANGNAPAGFAVPAASASASSLSLYRAPGGNGYYVTAAGSISAGPGLDDQFQVGGTHPSAVITVRNPQTGVEMLYYTKSNDDSLGVVRLDQYGVQPDFDLSPIAVTLSDGHPVRGAYPSALAASPDASTLYVAESGINSVAVIDISRPLSPKLLGRIPTGWYPTSLAITSDGRYLFVTNAKGIGEDINTQAASIASDPATDSNSIFGTVQLIYVGGRTVNGQPLDNTTILTNNYALNQPADTSVVPAGGNASSRIKHVFVIVQENKTFDSVLGGLPSRFGSFSSQTFQNAMGRAYVNPQFAAVTPNLRNLASNFATAVNFYSDAEDSNAGAQFLGSGTASDFTERMVQLAAGRGLLANRDADPEDYPEGGYIFNNAARHGVGFKDYGFLTALAGSDNGASIPSSLDDPASGLLGLPQLAPDSATLALPLVNLGDAISPITGLGSQYFLSAPGLAVLGENNPSGEARLDSNYPGVNFNISDQRRALEFNRDFDRMAAAGTVPQLIYIYLPNAANGAISSPNASSIATNAALQQTADGDTALGMVVSHLLQSPIYFDPASNTGSAIFVTFASSQSAVDHIHPHRNLLVAVSPFAKPAFLATRHYSTASIVKTAELLLGLPPNNLGDLFATDLRDMFQNTFNGISAATISVTKPALSKAARVTIGR